MAGRSEIRTELGARGVTAPAVATRECRTEAGEVPREVFNTNEAAEFLRVSPALLELLRVKGGGPRYVKLSRRCLYRRSALDEWLKERERASTADVSGQSHSPRMDKKA